METTLATHTEPRLLEPDDRPAFSILGIDVRPLVRVGDFGGALTLMEQHVAPGAGTPPHSCHHEDKVFYVLEGTFDILLGQQMHRAGTGATLLVPRGTPHRFENIGMDQGRLLVLLTPGGHEDFLQNLSHLLQHSPADAAAFARLNHTYGVEVFQAAE